MPVRVWPRKGAPFVVADGITIKRENIVNQITETDGTSQRATGPGDCLHILDAESNTVAVIPVDAVLALVVEADPPALPLAGTTTSVTTTGSSVVYPQTISEAVQRFRGGSPHTLMAPGGFR